MCCRLLLPLSQRPWRCRKCLCVQRSRHHSCARGLTLPCRSPPRWACHSRGACCVPFFLLCHGCDSLYPALAALPQADCGIGGCGSSSPGCISSPRGSLVDIQACMRELERLEDTLPRGIAPIADLCEVLRVCTAIRSGDWASPWQRSLAADARARLSSLIDTMDVERGDVEQEKWAASHQLVWFKQQVGHWGTPLLSLQHGHPGQRATLLLCLLPIRWCAAEAVGVGGKRRRAPSLLSPGALHVVGFVLVWVRVVIGLVRSSIEQTACNWQLRRLSCAPPAGQCALPCCVRWHCTLSGKGAFVLLFLAWTWGCYLFYPWQLMQLMHLNRPSQARVSHDSRHLRSVHVLSAFPRPPSLSRLPPRG